ncbi:MAG: M28 family peptidase [Verrucomicrobia bacterium]|nr:M28 family peptidase [Verrucomicrobiota bacterium]
MSTMLPRNLLVAALLGIGLSSPTRAKADESTFLSKIRQVTFAGKRAGEGYFNADGTKLIFQSERDPANPFYQIFLLDLETGDTTRISPGHGKTTCSWVHPDGSKALFASTQEDPDARAEQEAELKDRAEGKQKRYAWDYDEFFDLYAYDFKTKQYTNLTHTRGYDAEGCYSPDGTQIVFSSNRAWFDPENQAIAPEDRAWFAMNPSFGLDLYLMNADGSGLRRLTSAPGYDGGPFFSRDGKTICFRRFDRKGETAEVYTIRTDGTEERQLTRLGAMSWAPFFHPSGKYLIFNTNTQGFANFELYLVDAAGTKDPVRVTFTDGWDGLASFSPDGTKLTWSSKRGSDGLSQIFLADWNHEAALAALAGSGAPSTNAPAPPASAPGDALREAKPEIRAEDLRAHVETLSSDALTGRMTGTEGEQLATAYAARAFDAFGLKPWREEAGKAGYFQEFTFTAGVALGPNNALTLQRKEETIRGVLDSDWRPISFSRLGTVDPAEIVFAGYGIEIPEGQAEEDGSVTKLYTSYYQTDPKDKWVLMFRFVPEGLEGEARRRFLRYASLRHKALNARERGARGVIFVSGPNSQVKEDLVPLTFDASLADSGIPALSISTRLGEQLVAAAGKNLKELQDGLDKGEMMIGLPLPGTKLGAEIDIVQQSATGRNVIGRLPAATEEGRKRPALILGAHIDHLGNKPNSSSRALGKEQYDIHHGADDNASGTAGLLELAHFLADAAAKGTFVPERDLLFAAWSGEEMGLFGSAHFSRELAQARKGDADAKLKDVLCANLNMDMIGRLRGSLVLQGIGSSSLWTEEVERRNAPVGLALTLQQDTYISTDATSFYLRGVPILSAFTGAHEDYHRPSDTADKCNYEGMKDITRFMGLVARGLATSVTEPDFIEIQRQAPRGQRAGLRVWLGTIPDYAQGEITGVKLSGATPGGPAAAAGVEAGDIITKLDGKQIKNIYDYTYTLEALKVGKEIEMEVRRKDATVLLKVTPGSRE